MVHHACALLNGQPAAKPRRPRGGGRPEDGAARLGAAPRTSGARRILEPRSLALAVLKRRSLALAVLLMVSGGAPSARGQAPPAGGAQAGAQALDQVVERIEIRDTPVCDALRQIERRTGARLEIADEALAVLPYGAQTLVSVDIVNMSVRDGLRRVLCGLGLRLEPEGEREGTGVHGERLRILPAACVERLGRRVTLDEINLLNRLADRTWDALSRTEDVSVDFRIDPSGNPKERFEAAMAQTASTAALAQLESALQTLGWVWWPEGPRIVLATRRTDVERRLDRPLDMTYSKTPLDDILVDLGKRSGVTLMFEPGSLAAVSASERAVDLVQRGVSVRQTLERICGATGLSYEVRDEGVQIKAPADLSAGPSAANITRWIRVEVEIQPGVKMDVFLPEDRLPPALRERARQRLEELFRTPAPDGP